jgi:ABC-2 type transport system ATP-binding protein
LGAPLFFASESIIEYNLKASWLIQSFGLRNLSKSFDGTKAVDGVSFTVNKGEIFGLLGPNGAGKTTLIRMILGIFQPDSGEIRFSFSPDGRLLPERVGYLPEERGLYDNRRVCDTLVFLASLKGMDARLARERAFLWLQRLQLERYFHRPIRELSKGCNRRFSSSPRSYTNPTSSS